MLVALAIDHCRSVVVLLFQLLHSWCWQSLSYPVPILYALHVSNSLFFSIDPVILVFVYCYKSTIKFDEVSLVSFNSLTNLSQRIWSFLQLVADTSTLCKKLLWWMQPSISIITSVNICSKTSFSSKLLSTITLYSRGLGSTRFRCCWYPYRGPSVSAAVGTLSDPLCGTAPVVSLSHPCSGSAHVV